MKNPHAQALSKLGASKGGLARAAALTKAERVKIALQGARARWQGHTKAPKLSA